MSAYEKKPDRFLDCIHEGSVGNPVSEIYCAGFELKKWRGPGFAKHLIEWLPDYALIEEELDVNHGNAYVKLLQAAVRVYTSEKYKRRGEAGEIALHAICRDYFGTVPISPRVFYKSASNDVVKSFDLVHAYFPNADKFEIWLGESKLYDDNASAVKSAIASVKEHVEGGFLSRQKLLLGPQIPKTTPHYEKILKIFKTQTSIDEFLSSAVFVVGILCNANSAKAATERTAQYVKDAKAELDALAKSVADAGLTKDLKMRLVYVPLADKAVMVDEFDKHLKALQ
jgi:hypothetical protein